MPIPKSYMLMYYKQAAGVIKDVRLSYEEASAMKYSSKYSE